MWGELRSYVVEMVYTCFFLSWHMTLPLFQEYVQAEISKKYHLDTSDFKKGNSYSGNFHPPNTDNITTPSTSAQEESAISILSLQIAEGLPAVVSVIILGAVGDRTGRRKIMIVLPTLGITAYSLLYILILYTGWNIDGLFMASALRGLSGSSVSLMAGSSFYAINSVAPENRSSRLAVQEFINGATYAIGNIVVGVWVHYSGFLQPFWFTFCLSLFSVFLVVFGVEEIQTARRTEPSTENCCYDTFQPLLKLFKCKDAALLKIWFAILAFQTYAMVHIGQLNTLVLYLLGKPFVWPSVKIGIFLSVGMACSALGTVLAVPFLRYHVSDTTIAAVGLVSKAAGTLWIGVIQSEAVLYFSILLLAFQLLPFPMMRAIVSRGIHPTDQGSLFALMHCAESLIHFLSPLIFTVIYASTLRFYTGFIFIVAAIILLIPAGFTLGIKYLDSKISVDYQAMEDRGTELAASPSVASSSNFDDLASLASSQNNAPISTISVS
ncbi:solute carrier family 46 member 3-like [Octopus vulgaris]|uniref:Solute carrier family 46 member 3-like n=3 Tax=Octopus TaxID=6643 RepID=A0AA36AI13_OCTVU|nr:solute carrier family 46 member 3 [Octopus bimaculoides]XP_029644374.1 solute carrier family 46 member 3-like [Octopus sinensis]CAI9716536.1 solute carrier family 46 member 3-like [Octopus vulgaris]|eukprot:XP_014775719.1 PREDICTED: solute carrier family 46 member 3-like [Octopus bimaculoides]